MISKKIVIVGVCAALSASLSSRADIYQSLSFSTNGVFSGSGNDTFIPLGYFSANFAPFSGNSNDLTGFQIDWTVTVSASGVVGTNGQSGGFGSSFGGTYQLDGSGYNGNGGNVSGNSSVQGGLIPLSTTTITNYATFSATNVNYNPAFLTDVLGSDPLDLSWQAALTLSYGNLASGQFSETGSVTLIYNTVPEPGTLALAGLGASAACWLRRRKA